MEINLPIMNCLIPPIVVVHWLRCVAKSEFWFKYRVNKFPWHSNELISIGHIFNLLYKRGMISDFRYHWVVNIDVMNLKNWKFLQLFRCELVHELFSQHIPKKWVHNQLLNFSVHSKCDQKCVTFDTSQLICMKH